MADGKPSIVTKVPSDDVLAEKGVTHAEQVDLTKDLEARLRNPLSGLSYDSLMENVEQFAEKRGLQEHLPVLRRGALVAQNPDSYEEITGPNAPTPEEIAGLREEKEHKWRMPRKLFFTIAICSIGAAVQGWDQTGSNGANIFFPKHYGIDPKEDGITGEEQVRREIVIGIINAAPYLGSA